MFYFIPKIKKGNKNRYLSFKLAINYQKIKNSRKTKIIRTILIQNKSQDNSNLHKSDSNNENLLHGFLGIKKLENNSPMAKNSIEDMLETLKTKSKAIGKLQNLKQLSSIRKMLEIKLKKILNANIDLDSRIIKNEKANLNNENEFINIRVIYI